jgi:hypothetical protein
MVLFSIFLSICFSVIGQNNIIDYQYSGRYIFYNPSFNDKKDNIEISIFPIASTDFELSVPISLNDIFIKKPESDKFELNFGRLSERVGGVNKIMFNSTVGFFTITGRLRSANWGFQVYDNVDATFSFDNKIIEFLNKGNGAFLDHKFLTKIPISFRHFNTWQISYSKGINQKLRFGISAKLYFGKSTLDSRTDLSIFTDSKKEYIDIGLSGKFKASGPIVRSINYSGFVNGFALQPDFSIAKYLFEFKNPGLGVDFGFDYKFSKKFNISASIIDFGIISWFSDINSIKINGNYRWNGFDISNLINYPNDKTVFDVLKNISFADSILYNALKPTNQSFITLTPLKIYFSTDYLFNSKILLSFVNRISLFDGFINETFLLSGNYLINDQCNFYSGLCFTNHSYFNIPMGFTFKNDKLKISLSTSNFWGVFMPSYSKNFGGSLSINLYFNVFSKAELEKMKYLPFFRPYKKWVDK